MKSRMKKRRLFLILGICCIDTNSTPSDLISLTALTAKPAQSDHPFDGHTLWIVDENSGLCLGAHGFGQCGDVNLWRWRSFGRTSEYVMFQSVISVGGGLTADDDKEQQCLGKLVTSGQPFPVTTLRRCSSSISGPTMWEYDFESQRLSTGSGIISRFLGHLCVLREDESASTQHCSMGYTRLRPVIHTVRKDDDLLLDYESTTDKPSSAASAAAAAANELTTTAAGGGEAHSSIEYGNWICPKTGLVFPRNLDDRVHRSSDSGKQISPEGRQIFIGGGVFTKTMFNYDFKVYTLGWYVEMNAAQKDSSLKKFEGLTEIELASSPEFYDSIVSQNATYDRTIMVKLAMALKKDLMIKGLVEELQVQPKNAKLLAAIGEVYTDIDCPKGLEIMFTWRVPHSGMPNSTHEVLEVRIAGKLYATIDEPGLAHDFYYQFIRSDDPVSPAARIGFASGFPTLLSKKQTKFVPVTRPPLHPLPGTATGSGGGGGTSTTASTTSTSTSSMPALIPYSDAVYEELKDLRFKVHGKRRGSHSSSRGVPLWQQNQYHVKPGQQERMSRKVRDTFKSNIFQLLSLADKVSSIWQRVTRGDKVVHTEEHRRAFFARWHAREDSLLIHRRDTRVRDEIIACLLIFSYALLLVILSMPAPLIKRTARVAAIMKRKLKLEIAHIRRTVSMTSLSSSAFREGYRSLEALQDAIR